MTARVAEDEWAPLNGAIPEAVDGDKIYLIPTRTAIQSAGQGESGLCYTDTVRFLPKAARANGLPVEFSLPEGERHYIQEFSVESEMWSLGLALMSMANDWLILTVSLFIANRADREGWTPEQAQELPLKVLIAETESGRTLSIEGQGSEVLEALQILHEGSVERKKRKTKKNKHRG